MIDLVKDHATKPLKGEDIEVTVKEQVKQQPTSLTKENILLREENEKLRQKLLQKDKEIDQLHLLVKELRKARDDGLDRIGELSKIIEKKQLAEESLIKNDNYRGYEADKLIREQRVVHGLSRKKCLLRKQSMLKKLGKTISTFGGLPTISLKSLGII